MSDGPPGPTDPMAARLARRAAGLLGLLVGVSALAFLLTPLLPGDPARARLGDDASAEALAAERHELGLDRPLVVQYGDWVAGVVRGDLGRSFVSSREVAPALADRAEVTVSVAVGAAGVAAVLGIGLGVFATVSRRKVVRGLFGLATAVAQSLPTFFVAIVLAWAFAVSRNWLPATGYVPLRDDPTGWARGLVLPVASLALVAAAPLARQTQVSLDRTLRQDHVRLMLTHGASPARLVLRHALRPALAPVLTVLAFQTTVLVGGALAVEQVFALPGLGSFAVGAVRQRDIPVIQGVVLVSAVVVALISLLLDAVQGWIDPRTHGGEGR